MSAEIEQSPRRSAAYLFLYLIVVFLIVGVLITALNPSWEAILDSQLYSFDTQWGTDLDNWLTITNAWIGFIALIAILITAFINSREA